MKDGFVKVAAGFIDTVVADCEKNTAEIKKSITLALKEKAKLIVLPELSVTGYTCGDLFFSDTLKSASLNALEEIVKFTRKKDIVVAVGVPLLVNAKLYNCAAVIYKGEILGVVPKVNIPNYNEFYEKRQFASGNDLPLDATVELFGKTVPFGKNIVFKNKLMPEFCFGAEICEDLWAVTQPCEKLAKNGATIILNLSASNESVGKAEYRKALVSLTSARLMCGYCYSSASYGESTGDLVFSGHNMICENGHVLSENPPFGENRLIFSEIDVKYLTNERNKNTSFNTENDYRTCFFEQGVSETTLTRFVDPYPFIPNNNDAMRLRSQEVLNIQVHGLKKRVMHTNAKKLVIGISGGLDSTLALLIAVDTVKSLGRDVKDVLAVTMPCFGTSKRTHNNSKILCEELGVDFKEINIKKAVTQHLKDIGQPENTFDAAYENAQARERTQVLMDLANRFGGLVVGTGDLSESALGWATYNGDHMSMYGVNASVPKTLVKHLVEYKAETSNAKLNKVLLDILATPVSPELLPTDKNGEIAQKTEDLVGPYELHDFYLYHTLRLNESPLKILRLALIAFKGIYDNETVLKWLKVFVRRFFSQQFKRSCMPDSPKVGSVSLSPRGDWRMPSDASANMWLKELENIKF